jgi:hypothetical protein
MNRVSRHLTCLFLFCAACTDDAATSATTTSATAGSGATTTSTASGADGGDLPCDVAALVNARCEQCHSNPPRYGAPMPLLDVADFDAIGRDGRLVHDLVAERVRADTKPMPPPPESRLDDEELAVLDAWFAAGRPAASDDCGGDGGGGGAGGGYEPDGLDCEVDTVLSRAAAYTMPSGVEDETKCFGIELANDGPKKHIVGIGPDVDEDQIVHHFLLFRAPTAQPSEPFDCSLFPPDWTLLYAWAPGAPAQDLPEEAGFPIEEGETAHLVLQMHYNNYSDVEVPRDDTRVELCTTTDLRPNDAGVMAFGGADFVIPARGEAEMTCAFDAPEQNGGALPVNIFQSWPHMHALGRSMRTMVEKSDGTTVTMVDVPEFSFTSQLLYPTDVVFEGGDRVTTTCTWSNPTDQPVGYGEASDAEMCFNIVTYWPAIDVEGFTPSLPTTAATCQSE